MSPYIWMIFLSCSRRWAYLSKWRQVPLNGIDVLLYRYVDVSTNKLSRIVVKQSNFNCVILSKLLRTISYPNYYQIISAVKWHFTLMYVSGSHIWWQAVRKEVFLPASAAPGLCAQNVKKPVYVYTHTNTRMLVVQWTHKFGNRMTDWLSKA